MAIRSATLDDLTALADLAHDQRIRLHGWDPAFWPVSPNAREVLPLFLRWTLESARSIAVVATAGQTLAGYAIADPLSGSDAAAGTWVIDDVGVAAPASWPTLGPVLLAAVAGTARRLGATTIVAPCAAADRTRREMYTAAGLDLNCWYRHLRLTAPTTSPEPLGGDDPGLPLPHLHPLAGRVAAAESVVAPGAHALLTPSLSASPGAPPGGFTALADPVIGADSAALWRVLNELEGRARDRGDDALVVAVGPGEEPLDGVLDGRGYSRPVEWWTFRPSR